MIIGIDFDGTIADTNTEKSAWIQRELSMQVPVYLCDRTSCVPLIGELEYKRMCNEVYDRDTTLRLPAVAGVLEAISEVKKNNQLIVVTARVEDMLDSARTWLFRHPETSNIEISGVPVDKTQKAEICHKEGIQVLVDDDERHLYDASALGILAILFKQSGPETFRTDRIQVCSSWEDITCYIHHLTESEPNRESEQQ